MMALLFSKDSIISVCTMDALSASSALLPRSMLPSVRLVLVPWMVTLAGVIQGLRLKNSKKGDRYATFFLEDLDGIVEVIAWPEAYRKNEPLITGADPVSLTGKLDITEERCQIIADQFVRLDEARARTIRELKIQIDGSRFTREDLERLGQTLACYPGNCPTYLHVKRDAYETRISLEKHGVATNHELIAALAERLTGVEARFVS